MKQMSTHLSIAHSLAGLAWERKEGVINKAEHDKQRDVSSTSAIETSARNRRQGTATQATNLEDNERFNLERRLRFAHLCCSKQTP
jgi:hypothetical protein